MRKWINFADRKELMDNLKELYGQDAPKNDQGETIDKEPYTGATGKERGTVAYRMGEQPAFNQGCHNPYSKRGKA